MNADDRASTRALLCVLAVAAFARLATLGMYPLMDASEARYAEIARKMLEAGDWITPWFDYGVPFWGKPPLSFWLTAASFKLFGTSEFAARLPHWVGGMFLAWLIWEWSARRSRREAAYALSLLIGSALYFVAAGAVMTDMALAVGTALAMRGFWLGLHGTGAERGRERWLLFLGIGLGLLAKGPIALALIGLPIAAWTLATGNLAFAWRGLPWLRGGVAALTIALPWYFLLESRTPGFLNYFLVGEHWLRFTIPGWKGDLYGTTHQFPRGTIWLFAFAAFIPWTILLPTAALRWRRTLLPKTDRAEKQWRLYLLLWGLTPCVFFTLAGNVLWTYVLPGLPGLALWAAAWLRRYPAQASVSRLLMGGVVLTLLGLAGFVVNLEITGRATNHSAKAVVVAYQSLRTSDEGLIFLGKRPSSAAFYSGGKAEQVQDAAQLARRLELGPAFVAIETGTMASLSAELLPSFKLLSRHGRFDLFIVDRRPPRLAPYVGGKHDGP